MAASRAIRRNMWRALHRTIGITWEQFRTGNAKALLLSAEASAARRVPAPTLLLQAEQDRPELPAKARVARAARVPNGPRTLPTILSTPRRGTAE